MKMRPLPRALSCLLLLVLLPACASNRGIRELRADPAWTPFSVAAPLPAAGWARGRAEVVHIYIEGDGVAYSTRTTPSPDPTPITPTALLLARRDTAPAAAYLGRPCQYVTGDACSRECWTTGRFSATVLLGMNALMDAAMRQTGARRAVLIGFSGGGAVAALLAEERTDVAALVTVCGNLDPAVWTAMHGVTPLHGSLNPADRAERLSSLPQTHFLGEKDANITRRVTDSFVSRLKPGAPVAVRVEPGLGHGGEAWAEAWPALLAGARLAD
ncbi:alpha/beta hydrolase family protein [Desulfovibrio sp.]